MMKAIKHMWITARECIGIVLAEDEHKQMGYISAVKGFDEEADIEDVKKWGAKLTIEQAKGFFGESVNEETYGR